MSTRQLVTSATHPASAGSPAGAAALDPNFLDELKQHAARLPVEGRIPSLAGATGWLNSEPLTPDALRGKVVLFEFWTFTCINWLRTESRVRAWAEKYKESGLVVVGVHTPEFSFEHDADNVRRAVAAMRIEYPVALDPDYAVWQAFDNNYWPAMYFADAEGRIRHHYYGEGEYEMSEMVIQQLLADAGFGGFSGELVTADGDGIEAQADWADLETSETYVGYRQAQGYAGADDIVPDLRFTYTVPASLDLNTWALGGEWTAGAENATANAADASIAFRFHARDLHLVMGTPNPGASVRFRVTIDGGVPGDAHGIDCDADGAGVASDQRLYQLIRQPGNVQDRTAEITFLDPGVEVFVFTFG